MYHRTTGTVMACEEQQGPREPARYNTIISYLYDAYPGIHCAYIQSLIFYIYMVYRLR